MNARGIKYPSVKFVRKDQRLFFATMRSRVNEYFEQNNIKKTGNWKMYSKAILLLVFYITPYVWLLFDPTYGNVILMFVLMGFGVSGVGLAVMHDANHSSFSDKKWINEIAKFSMELIGCLLYTSDAADE